MIWKGGGPSIDSCWFRDIISRITEEKFDVASRPYVSWLHNHIDMEEDLEETRGILYDESYFDVV